MTPRQVGHARAGGAAPGGGVHRARGAPVLQAQPSHTIPSSPPTPHAEQAVLESDISVVLPEHGQRLVFEPLSQRLRRIQIDDATRCCVSYRGRRVFGGAAQLPTLGRVYDALGPTYPGASGCPRATCCGGLAFGGCREGVKWKGGRREYGREPEQG